MKENYTMIAKTMFGFEPILTEELKSFGAENIEPGNRMVTFTGDKKLMYKVNIACRTALKVLKPIHHFQATDEKSYYDGIQNVDWSQYIDVNQTFAVDSRVDSKYFKHSHFISLKTKDAIVDQFRENLNVRPSIDSKAPQIPVNIHIQDTQCSIALDSSGASLHHRGYRTVTNEAPVNEVLAAGLLLLSGWKGQSHFLDPMCGSGTICVEAAMIALNIPANIGRKEFAFMYWPDYDKKLFISVLEELNQEKKDFNFRIEGYDKANSAIEKAHTNIKNAGLQNKIKLKKQDFFTSEKDFEGKLHMVFNPPYDERLSIDLQSFYSEMGNTFKRHYPGTDAWFIAGNIEAIKHIGLRPSRKIKTFNGPLEARLVKYEIYEGSKKGKYMNNDNTPGLKNNILE